MTCDERNSFGSLCKLGGLAGPCLAHTDQDLAFKGGSQDHWIIPWMPWMMSAFDAGPLGFYLGGFARTQNLSGFGTIIQLKPLLSGVSNVHTHTYTKQSKISCCSLKGSQPQRQSNGSQELLCCPTCALCLMLQLQSTDVHSPPSLLGLLLAAILLLDHFQAKQAPVGHRINQQYQEFSAIHKRDMGRR